MATLSSSTWNSVPEHIIVQIMSYLSQHDRCMAGMTCKLWQSCLKSPHLWEKFSFSFQLPVHGKLIHCLEIHGHHMKFVSIDLDQSEAFNRINSCCVLNKFATLKERKLIGLAVRFTGENPLFYAGLEFVESLQNLFIGLSETSKTNTSLKYIDLSGLTVSYDDSIMDVLSENNPQLEYLNIQNNSLICKVSPGSTVRLVQRCKHLKYLFLYHCSICDRTLFALAEQGREPIAHLSIICRREQKFGQDLSSEAWSKLTSYCPNLRVTLGFDHTCPLHKVTDIMKPEIPVGVLRLETFTTIFEEVRLATQYYKNTITKLVLQTRPSIELSAAILELCLKSASLQSLLVYCILDKETVDAILEMKPDMKERGSYILKWQPEPEPWIVGYEDDYLSEQMLNI